MQQNMIESFVTHSGSLYKNSQIFNNLSLTLGNEGNHIPMIVIPSPSSGMRQGHLVSTSHNNHYSLLRTIEDSLQLPRLTNNDKYAQPMNEYWP